MAHKEPSDACCIPAVQYFPLQSRSHRWAAVCHLVGSASGATPMYAIMIRAACTRVRLLLVYPSREGIMQSSGDTDDLYGDEPFSPRSELLSSASSPRRRDDGGSDDRTRRRRGASERYRREREQVHSGASHREVTRLLVDQEYETAKIRKGLIDALDRLRVEATRADEAERSRAEMVANFRTLNESRVKALKEVEKVTQELQMYKLQYEHAQNEITRAQGILKVLQEQKEDAERSAARSRRIVRELNQNRLITEAKEEGRRLGFAAGFRRAQTELGAEEGADSNIDDAILAMELREGQGEEEYFHDDHNQDVDQELSPSPPEPVPIAQPVPQFSPQAAPPLLSSHSPSVEPYSLPIPSADQLNGPSTDGGVIPLPPPFELAGIPKTNSNHSRRHSIGSASTSSRISQLDLLKTAPNGDRGPLRPRNERELSMIREDGNSSRAGTPSHQRSKSAMSQQSQNSFRSKGNVAMDPNLPPLAEQGRSQPPPDPNSRYDDGRYTGRGDARDWAPQSPKRSLSTLTLHLPSNGQTKIPAKAVDRLRALFHKAPVVHRDRDRLRLVRTGTFAAAKSSTGEEGCIWNVGYERAKRRHHEPDRNGDGNGDGAAATLGQHHELHRVPSNASMRSGSYDPSKYLDPAFYGADGT
ncbi:hypothetical protein PLEOSDRAFT_1098342 [Pleurotus ostreatus PC15]|uniref:Uncharacterized protein n=1 Tax=Pleurotus ostreatus (strain PC15) TaxID=1137138 RepID=A0A067NEH3_PLEO1|nr:hypothetical protein PLEOSDRAFT_1098342 [Pleurotus ostreatus PC15]